MQVREPLSNADTAWLRMEHPTSPMMITIVLVFRALIDLGHLRSTLEQRLLPFARFRQRVVQSGDRLYWQEDPSFDLDHHLQWQRLPPPGDEAALRHGVGELMSQQLDLSRPLWQFHLVEGLGAGCALVGRVHHCLADGPALMYVLHALADTGTTEPQATQGTEPDTPPDSITSRVVDWVARGGLELMNNPRSLLGLARMGTGVTSSLVKLMLRPPDPDTVFRGQLSTVKRVAWSPPLELQEVKSAGGAEGGTVNDVMLAAATGALRRYMQRRGEPVGGVTLRAGLSVNLRSPQAEVSLGNQAGALLVELPIGLGTPLERLRQVRRTMDELKDSPESSVVWGLLNALGMAPPDLLEVLVERYCSQDTAVIANVRGATERIYLAGRPLESLVFWVPTFGRVGLSLSISSYAGQVWFAVATDQSLVPDPETIVAEFLAEFKALRASTTGMESEQAVAPTQEGSIEAMGAMLDEAIGKLDALLEDRDGENPGQCRD